MLKKTIFNNDTVSPDWSYFPEKSTRSILTALQGMGYFITARDITTSRLSELLRHLILFWVSKLWAYKLAQDDIRQTMTTV